MSQRIVCLVAGQRCGTNALRNIVTDTDKFANLGEIFNTATLDWPGNFFSYCCQRNVRIGDILSGHDAERFCKDYVATLREAAGEKHVLLDVKFNSWGELRVPWTFMHQEPYFLRHLKNQEARMIFIWRKDLVAQVLSDRIADRIKKWHNIKVENVMEPFDLDIEENRDLAKQLCLSEAYFFDRLKAYPHKLVYCYETIFNSAGALEETAKSKLCAFMGEPYRLRNSGYYHRNQINKEQVVANFTEVAAAIADVTAAYRGPFLAEMEGLP